MNPNQHMHRPTTAVINLDHLGHNVRALKAIMPGQFFCPMIKANAYGHGDVAVAQFLQAEGIKNLGVALVEEGIHLRKNGIHVNLLFFTGFSEHSAPEIIENRLIPVLSTWGQLRSIEKAAALHASGANYPVHVKFDTGMNRLGFPMEDADALVQYFHQSKLKLEGILSHLHSGEDAGHFFGESFKQLTAFRNMEEKFAEFKCASHILNSSGLLNFTHHQGQKLPHHIHSLQGSRPGLSIYGISSLDKTPIELKPVMTLRSQILKYKKIQKDEGVSYGVTWKASRESIIGVVPMGYADGYRRSLSNRGKVLFRGKIAPVVGTVCMDYFMVDLTDLIKNEPLEKLVPEEVTLWGEDPYGNSLSVKELAKEAGSIAWEMLTGVSERVPRVYKKNGELL